MSSTPLIDVQGVWKRYGLPLLPTLKRGINRVRGVETQESGGLPWALQDISFQAFPGETLGIVGRNGSGKSTLLKVLAGVTPPTQGSVHMRGSLFPMIELNAGIHMELTGRENIQMLGAVLGLTHSQIQQQMPAIEAFCELGEWLDRPVRMYSSGMMVRLGFGTGVHVNADVLLMDEVMAVGDVNFFNKCLGYLENLRERGKCTLFVSHNLHRMRRMCDRVLVLDKGVPLFVGPTEEGMMVYEEVIRRDGDAAGRGNLGQFDHIHAKLTHPHFLPSGSDKIEIEVGEDVTFRFDMNFAHALHDTSLHVALESVDAVDVVFDQRIFDELPAGTHQFGLTWQDMRLKPGKYRIRIGIGVGKMQGKGFRVSDVAQLHIKGSSVVRGVYLPETHFTHHTETETP
ncbi:ABC transporter related protein [Magnetococcus marinus MC-1]|uniref:ABC transporter related protein n=1 Tax=Magnetococcus marinus (strain ATCC BAA-1437 / JCM 17883 / MC-1) TaxID=156889 RepID=A0L553_MAGMM|nr:polysaccharide ABC transporter ATP-binding protein [Magnetococcus marinus]ABK43096.1 ABC transporter related protein [Magnetococcus marinus MC-1]